MIRTLNPVVLERRLEEIRQGLLARRMRENMSEDDPPLPAEPTGLDCGSKAKIEVMRQRVEAGESVFHPSDSRQIMRRLDSWERRMLREATYTRVGDNLNLFNDKT